MTRSRLLTAYLRLLHCESHLFLAFLQTVCSAYSTTLPSSTNSPIIDLTTPIIVVTDLSLLLFFLLDGKWDWGKSIKSVFVTYRMKGDFVTDSQLMLYVN